MTKLDLEKLTLLSAALVIVLASALVVRGGGYGIAGLSWDSNLVVSRANLRVGPMTVVEGDRILSVNSRTVSRDADIRGVLRSLEADEIWLEVERADYRVAVPLTPEAIDANELPAILRGPYQVMRIDGREVAGDMNLAVMASWMEMNGDQPAVFTVSVPDYSFEGPVRRVRRPGPVIPVVILVFTLCALALIWLRGREEVMTRPRGHWHLLGVSLASGGALLAFLTWYDGFLADPVLLPFALVSMCLWRPSSLFLHQARRGRLAGPASIYFRLGVALPAIILLLASLYGWTRTLTDLSGSPLDGFVYDQLRLLILVGAAVIVAYHLADMGLQVAALRAGRRDIATQSPPWIGSILASLFIVAAIVGLSAETDSFLAGGFVPFLGGLVAMQWLGDMALLPRRNQATALPVERFDGPALQSYLVDAGETLDVSAPQYVCVFAAASVALGVPKPGVPEPAPDDERSDAEAEAEPDESVDIPKSLQAFTATSLDEPLVGLLELLDAEGGMFPRYTTIRGTDEAFENPFEGLGRSVGVELVLPLQPPEPEDDQIGMRAYLVSRRPKSADGHVTLSSAAPSAAAIDMWRQRFSKHAENWSRLRAAAAEAALTLVTERPVVEQVVVVDEPDEDERRIETARLHYLQQDSQLAHPVDEPDLIDDSLAARLPTFAASKGPMAITGQPGCGREFAARLIHELSAVGGGGRQDGPLTPTLSPGRGSRSGEFVVLNCSILPEAVVLAELAGEGDLPGRLTAAENGTLCVRDLSRLSSQTQEAALAEIKNAPVRLVLVEMTSEEDDQSLPAAIQRAVDEAVLAIPPLASRPDAVERAATYYLHRFAMTMGRVVTGFSDDALSWLRDQPWPGNYFELIGCIRTAVVRCDDAQIEPAHLSPTSVQSKPSKLQVVGETENLSKTLEQVERNAVLNALERADGNKSQAARRLGMKRTTFIRKLAKYESE